MNEKTKLALKVLLGLAVVGAGIWYFTGKPKAILTKDKNYWIKNIVYYTDNQEGGKGKGADAATLATFEDGYLQAWSNAIDSNSNFFIFNNYSYNAFTGKQEHPNR